MGLANSATEDANSKELASKLAEKLRVPHLTFTEQIDALWALCANQQYGAPAIQTILNNINNYPFERLENEIRYSELVKLRDINTALRIEGSAPHPQHTLTNQLNVSGLNNYAISLKYVEDLIKYDPFKDRVLKSLTLGLTSASITHQVIQETELYYHQSIVKDVINEEKYPYKADLIMGYKG